MPTRTPASDAARAARKTAAAQGGGEEARRAKPRQSPRPGSRSSASAADAASLRDLVARLGKLEVAGFAGRLVQGWRTDLEVIVAANRRSYAGLQEIVRRRTAQIREAVSELQTVGKVMAMVGAKESVRNLDDLALRQPEVALNDMRELADLAARSQREAFETVQQARHGKHRRSAAAAAQMTHPQHTQGDRR